MKNFKVTITGEVITKSARDLMLGEDPGGAYRLICDCIIGQGTDKIAKRILSGEIDLTGDSSAGIDITDSDPDDVKAYIEDLQYIYAGRVKLIGKWYRPTAVVTSLGLSDAKAAGEPGSTLNRSTWGRKRAEFYAMPGEVVQFAKCADGINRYIIFAPCGEPAQWIKPIKNVQEAVDSWTSVGRVLEEVGYCKSVRPETERVIFESKFNDKEADEFRELSYAAEDEEIRILHAGIAAKVREKAGSDMFEMKLLDGMVVQVPRIPFLHWALSSLHDYANADKLPKWECVSMSGIKMYNDNPYHSDWVLGAGLSINDCYSENVSSPAWEKAFEMQVSAVDSGDDKL